MIEVFGEN